LLIILTNLSNEFINQFIHLARTIHSSSSNITFNQSSWIGIRVSFFGFFLQFLSRFRLRFFYAATLCSSCLNHPEGSDLANNTTS